LEFDCKEFVFNNFDNFGGEMLRWGGFKSFSKTHCYTR
jgi:hypothetical protein